LLRERGYTCCPCSCIRAAEVEEDLETGTLVKAKSFEVTAGTPDGREFKLTASNADTILTIKQEIESLHGTPVFDQEILHPGAEEPLLNHTLLFLLQSHELYMITDPVNGAIKAKEHADAEEEMQQQQKKGAQQCEI
jgi:hypothetical protein